MNVQDFLQQTSQINQALVQDSRTLLALTVAWVDPLTILKDQEILEDEDMVDYYYENDALGQGIHVARTCFPDIYINAINQLRQGMSFMKVLDFIDEEIERQTGIEMSQHEAGYAYIYGIPMPWYGFDMEDPDLREDRDSEWHLASLFGIGIEDSDAYINDLIYPANAWDVAHVVQRSLWEYRHSPLHETLMWAIGYIFSNTTNSSVDYTWSEGCEFYPMSWTPENIAFASEICQEAGEIMQSAVIGLANAYDPAIKTFLKKIIKQATKHVKKTIDKGEKIRDFTNYDNSNPFNLRWDDLRASPDDAPELDAPQLPVRLGVA